MKAFIRRWLGINEEASAARKKDENLLFEMREEERAKKLRRMVGAAVSDAFEGKYDGTESYQYHERRNSVIRVLDKAAERAIKIHTQPAVDAYIKTEAFIDEIVERIRRKQL